MPRFARDACCWVRQGPSPENVPLGLGGLVYTSSGADKTERVIIVLTQADLDVRRPIPSNIKSNELWIPLVSVDLSHAASLDPQRSNTTNKVSYNQLPSVVLSSGASVHSVPDRLLRRRVSSGSLATYTTDARTLTDGTFTYRRIKSLQQLRSAAICIVA